MSISLYDVSVRTYLQTAKAMTRVLEKGRAHYEANGKDLSQLVEARLYSDMAPLRFQVVSVAAHSIGAMGALQHGKFAPPSAKHEDYRALQDLMERTVSELKQFTPEVIDPLEGKDVIFELGEMKLPFVARDFILSFSFPNFFFHATTAYDILRSQGVPVGKADFMGPLRYKR